MDEIIVVDVKTQVVLGMRKHGKYELIPQMIHKVYEFAEGRGIHIQGPPIFVCHEKTTEEVMKAYKTGNADVEIVWPITGRIEDTEEIKCYELPGGKMAKIVHKGPYEDCGPTYEKLFAWIEANGKKLAGPTREAYLNDPHQVSPEEILTDIYAPIE